VNIPTAWSNTTFSVDTDSIERNGSKVTFWEKLVYAKPDQKDPASGRMIKEKRVRRILDCASRTLGYTRGVVLAEKDRTIQSVSLDEAHVQMQAIPAASAANRELMLACPPPPAPVTEEASVPETPPVTLARGHRHRGNSQQ
jgi:hypothetical protein